MNGDMLRINPERLIWDKGRPVDFWYTHRAFIREFIKEFQLEAIPRKEYMMMDDPVPIAPRRIETERVAELELKIPPRPWPGYLKIPHFHFRNELYLLNDDQWGVFRERVVHKFQEKLKSASKLNFQQVMQLSETIDALG